VLIHDCHDRTSRFLQGFEFSIDEFGCVGAGGDDLGGGVLSDALDTGELALGHPQHRTRRASGLDKSINPHRTESGDHGQCQKITGWFADRFHAGLLKGLKDCDGGVSHAFGFFVMIEHSADDLDFGVMPNAGEHTHHDDLLGVFIRGVWFAEGDEDPFAGGCAFGGIEPERPTRGWRLHDDQVMEIALLERDHGGVLHSFLGVFVALPDAFDAS